jgi:hypothetical protein
MTRYVVLTIALIAVLVPSAAGAGGPVAGTDAGANGVTVPGLASRYVTVRAPGGTVVAQVDQDGGRIRASRVLRSRLVVPAVASDGSATGLSANGTTLVLATPRNNGPRRRSEFTVLDTRRLSPRSTISLRGDFTLDAISPDGDRLYLIESTSRDLTRYAVRAYDVGERRLLPHAIVDPEEKDEPMSGSPLARAMSPDGRWAYTLYDGNGEHPFIHALDTVAARAKCVDLDQLAGRDDLFSLRLKVEREGTVVVHQDGQPEPLLVVDPRSFAVREPALARPRASQPEANGGTTSWPLIVAGVALVGLVGVVAAVRASGARSAPAQ